MNILEVLVLVVIFLIFVVNMIIYILIDLRIAEIEERTVNHGKILKLLILESNQRDLEKNKKGEEKEEC